MKEESLIPDVTHFLHNYTRTELSQHFLNKTSCTLDPIILSSLNFASLNLIVNLSLKWNPIGKPINCIITA